MSYRIRLYLTHIATAIVAGYSVWYGLQVDGFSQLAFMVLFGASVIVPNAVAAWWLKRGLSDMERALAEAGTDFESTGLSELDQVTRRLRSVLAGQHRLVRDVEELLLALGSSSDTRRDGSAGRDELLSEALGRLSRNSARDVGSMMTAGNDISKEAHSSHRDAREQIETVDNAIHAASSLTGAFSSADEDRDACRHANTMVSESAASGRQLVERLILGMEEIQASVEFSEKKIAALGQQSEKINFIIETMQSLSARTDMLAINASIEAVRAGQEGRGFTVVAEEVRKLAETTTTASQEIAALVEAIQSEARDTVAVMAEERQQVQTETRLIEQTNDAFQSIADAAADASRLTEQISNSTSDQLRATREVVAALRQVSSIAHRIDEQSDAIRNKATDLIETAQDLEEELSPVFHYGDAEQPAETRANASSHRSASPHPEAGDELFTAAASGEFHR